MILEDEANLGFKRVTAPALRVGQGFGGGGRFFWLYFSFPRDFSNRELHRCVFPWRSGEIKARWRSCLPWERRSHLALHPGEKRTPSFHVLGRGGEKKKSPPLREGGSEAPCWGGACTLARCRLRRRSGIGRKGTVAVGSGSAARPGGRRAVSIGRDPGLAFR